MDKAQVASACERLVHPRVGDPAERQRQRRFLGVVLAGPFLAAAAAAQVLAARLDAAPTLALVCMSLCAGWFTALITASTGRRRIAEPLALALGAGAAGGLAAAAGGFASPLAVMLAALPVEAAWVGRTRRAALSGLVAAVCGALLCAALGSVVSAGADQVHDAWQWLVPLAYAASLWGRFAAPLLGVTGAAGQEEPWPELERVIDAVVLRVDATGDVVKASAQAGEMLGLPSDILLGRGLFDRIHVGDRVAYLSALADIRHGGGRCRVPLRLRVAGKPAGTPVHAHFHAELIGEGQSGRATIILRDDARTAELERALAEQTQKAEQSELTRTRMLASVSHELRTPLNAILGFSDVLANEMFGSFRDQRQREYVRLIHDAGSHLLSVVNALLDLAKIESDALNLRPERFRFEDAVELSASLVGAPAQARGVSLRMRVGAPVGEIDCDRRMLQQILINLLSNAVKFTPEGGTVTMTARRAGGRLDFEVADTGIGMTEEDLARIGTPFMQVENDQARRAEGTGLGLSLVKGLVGLQRGGMSIESAPGAGTCVSISLPLAETAAEEDGAAMKKDDDASEFDDDAFLKTA